MKTENCIIMFLADLTLKKFDGIRPRGNMYGILFGNRSFIIVFPEYRYLSLHLSRNFLVYRNVFGWVKLNEAVHAHIQVPTHTYVHESLNMRFALFF